MSKVSPLIFFFCPQNKIIIFLLSIQTLKRIRDDYFHGPVNFIIQIYVLTIIYVSKLSCNGGTHRKLYLYSNGTDGELSATTSRGLLTVKILSFESLNN